MVRPDELIAYVHRDVIDLLSAFLPNRRAEVSQLRQALARNDWLRLRHIAERMYALGNPYGFRHITVLGRALREACVVRDRVAIDGLTADYDTYLSKVTIIEIDVPQKIQIKAALVEAPQVNGSQADAAHSRPGMAELPTAAK
jgi:hypothetical protein